MSATIIPYYRVSTGGQGRSGLGLDAQRDAVTKFAANEGMEIAGEFVENVHSSPPPFVRPNSSGLTLRCPNWIACRAMYISFRAS
jgi:hypothetical protein